MENLPESLYVDSRGASSSNSVPQNTIGAAGAQSAFSAADREEIEQLIRLLNQSQTRVQAIFQLNRVYKMHKERGTAELGLLLSSSKDTSFSLLQELFLPYRSLSPPRLTMVEATRVCNALVLLQCIASHPETRVELIRAQMLIYIYPFLNTNERLPQFEYLRLSSLGVIGALVKEEGPNTTEIVHYLLLTEMFPLCLRCMDVGGDLTKSVATLVIGKMLEQPEAKSYCGSFAERFFAVSNALSKMVEEFTGRPPATLLKNILICYLRLSEISRCCNALRTCYPKILSNPTYLSYVCDESTRVLANHVTFNIMRGPQVQVEDLENQLSRMRMN